MAGSAAYSPAPAPPVTGARAELAPDAPQHSAFAHVNPAGTGMVPDPLVCVTTVSTPPDPYASSAYGDTDMTGVKTSVDPSRDVYVPRTISAVSVTAPVCASSRIAAPVPVPSGEVSAVAIFAVVPDPSRTLPIRPGIASAPSAVNSCIAAWNAPAMAVV